MATPPPPPKGKKPMPQEGPIAPSIDLNTVIARVRLAESRVDEIRKMVDFVEENMLSNYKKLNQDIKQLRGELDEMRRTMSLVEDRIVTVIKEIRLLAKREDVEVLKRYLEMWNPVKFATIDHVREIVKEFHEQGEFEDKEE